MSTLGEGYHYPGLCILYSFMTTMAKRSDLTKGSIAQIGFSISIVLSIDSNGKLV